MFSWFKKKGPPPVDVAIFASQAAKERALIRIVRTSTGPVLLVASFDETETRISALLTQEGIAHQHIGDRVVAWDSKAGPCLVGAERLRNIVGNLPEPMVVLGVEHHPHPSALNQLVEALAVRTSARPRFYAALDEPLMVRFGGSRTAELMETLGMEPDEEVAHSLVSSAFARACAKVGEKVKSPQDAPSMEEWIALNLPR